MNIGNIEKRPVMARAAIIRVAQTDANGNKSHEIKVSLSSETACRNLVHTRSGWAVGDVILSHTADAINTAWIAEGIPLRDEHGGRVVARGMECEIMDGKLQCNSIIWGSSERAQTIRQDVEAGVIREMSIEADYESEDVEDRGDGSFVVRKWAPLAAAFVPVPADPTVGVNREILQSISSRVMDEETTMTIVQTPTLNSDRKTILAETATVASATAVPAELNTITREGNMAKIEEGKDVLVPPAPVVEVHDENEITREELKDYSILRAIRAQVERKPDMAKLELSVSRKLARKFGKEPQGFFVPQGIFSRDFTTAIGNGAGLVPTEHMASEFIEILRSKMVLDRVGVRYINGLTGNVSIPKQTGATTAYWVAEGASPTESQPMVGQIELTPHTVGAFTDITRRLMLQGSPDAAALVQNDLLEVLARAIQDAVINGDGTTGKPTGILNASGVATATIATSGSPTWAEVVQIPGVIDKFWADGGNWVLNPSAFAALRATVRADYGDRFIADIVAGQKYVADEPAYTTAQVPAGTAIYGKWGEVIIGMWGALDLTVDPYSLSTSGGIRIVALQDCDVAIRHPEAFVKSAAFPTA